jgi:predicted metalloprotease with PDZ domain
LSDGEYGIQALMRDLSAEYGVERPFKEDELFAEIGRISGYPEMTDFLERHVGGTEPLPYAELLGYAGVHYAEEETVEVITAGGVSIAFNPRTERMVVAGTNKMDDFGRDLGFETGDELVAWNGKAIDQENFLDVIEEFKEKARKGDKIKVKVARKQEDGSYKEKTLKGRAVKQERTFQNRMKFMENPTESRMKLRKAWLTSS